MGGFCSICCNPGGEKKCCCFPLTSALIVIATFFGATGGYDIWESQRLDEKNLTLFASGILSCTIAGYIFFCSLLGILKCGMLAYIATMISVVALTADCIYKIVVFVEMWVVWGKGLNDGSINYHFSMVSSTITQLISISIILSFLNLFWSAACVYKAGGNGCEYKSYKDIQKQAPKAAAEEEKDPDV